MGLDVTVRAARRSDFDGIERVARAAWRAAYGDVLDAATIEEMIDEGYDGSVLERLVDLDEVGFFVAEADDAVVGYASCGMTDPAGVGDLDVYVHPDYCGDGIGTRLLSRGLEHLDEMGVGRVRDEVLVGNDVGNAFYRSHFEHVGRRTVDFGDADREVNVYERSVDRPVA